MTTENEGRPRGSNNTHRETERGAQPERSTPPPTTPQDIAKAIGDVVERLANFASDHQRRILESVTITLGCGRPQPPPRQANTANNQGRR